MFGKSLNGWRDDGWINEWIHKYYCSHLLHIVTSCFGVAGDLFVKFVKSLRNYYLWHSLWHFLNIIWQFCKSIFPEKVTNILSYWNTYLIYNILCLCEPESNQVALDSMATNTVDGCQVNLSIFLCCVVVFKECILYPIFLTKFLE